MTDGNHDCDLYRKAVRLVESIADMIVRGDTVYQCPLCYHRNTRRDCNEQGVLCSLSEQSTILTCTGCGEEVECETFVADEDDEEGETLRFIVHEARQIL